MDTETLWQHVKLLYEYWKWLLVDYKSLKPGGPIKELSPELIDEVLNHPAQRQNLVRIGELIAELRACVDWSDLNRFQRFLFKEIYEVELRRAGCSRMVKRLSRGIRPPTDAPTPPPNHNVDELDGWIFEQFVYERLARQLRTVGDALAWRSFGYFRPVIITLTFNDSPGPMAQKEGLLYELGRVDSWWKVDGQFGLLHDLTNCLRIADMTKFVSQTRAEFREEKKTSKASKEQRDRLNDVLTALTQDGPLSKSRPNSRFFDTDLPHKTDLKVLNELIQLAKIHGSRGTKLKHGRAIVVHSLPRIAAKYGRVSEIALESMVSVRRRALERAAIGLNIHQTQMTSGDMASRSLSVPPISIFPFSPEDCASLICDFLVFETIISLEMLVGLLRQEGISAEIALESKGGDLIENDEVIIASLSGRRVVIHPSALFPLHFELLDPTVWAKGIHEILSRLNTAQEPVIIYKDEAMTWEGKKRIEYFWRPGPEWRLT